MKLHVIDYGHNGDLPQSIRDQIPDDTLQTIFRTTLNSHLRDGKSEMHAFTKAWRALSDLGYAKGEDGTWALAKAEDPPPAADPNGPPPGLKAKATGVPRCGTCRHFDSLGKCLKFNDYPVNAGMVCSEWEARPEVQKLYVPPVEVQAAAKGACEYGTVIQGLTIPLSSGEGIGEELVRAIAEHFASPDAVSKNDLAAWGGLQAGKWAGRVLKKLGPPQSTDTVGPADQQLPDATTSDVDFTVIGTIEKLDNAQHLAFGWWSVVDIEGRLVEDTQEDRITSETIEHTAYEFVLYNGEITDARTGSAMHETHGVGRMVESCVFTNEKQRAMQQSLRDQGIAEATIDLHCVAWWGGMKIDDEEVWSKVVTGELRAWSIGGRGKRASV